MSTLSFLSGKVSPVDFGKWAKKRSIALSPDVAFLVPTTTMGVGVYARRALPRGAVIVSCPVSSGMSPYDRASRDSPCTVALTAYVEDMMRSANTAKRNDILDPVACLALRLAAELARPRSPWRPWLEACPTMPTELLRTSGDSSSAPGFPCGLTVRAALYGLSDDEKTARVVGALLPETGCMPGGGDGSPAPSLAWTNLSQQLQEIDVGRLWRQAQLIMERYPQHWPRSVASYDVFCQCLSQVLSRNFHREEVFGREGPYLLPGLDVVNHTSKNANGAFELRGGGRKHELTFTIIASRDMLAGEQVLCDYGAIGAARFLTEFSFVNAETVREDAVRFGCQTLVGMAEMVEVQPDLDATGGVDRASDLWYRVESLQRVGILFDEGLYLHSVADDTESNATLPAAVRRERDVFLTVVYLLMVVTRPEFNELMRSTVSRHWAVNLKAIPALGARAQWALEQKRQAVLLQTRVVSEYSWAEAETRAMVLRVLDSERCILERYQVICAAA